MTLKIFLFFRVVVMNRYPWELHYSSKLKKGMAVCIEPMVNTKSSKVKMGEDGWTALAVDGMPSAHFEHTLLVDEERAEIITIPEGFEKAEPFFGAVAATV